MAATVPILPVHASTAALTPGAAADRLPAPDRVETGYRDVPWRWIVLVALLSLPALVAHHAHGANLTFTLRRFIEDPKLISAISSLDVFFNIILSTTCLYLSDRIWTRFGRRSPFLIIAWGALAVCFLGLAFANSAWVVVPLAVCTYMFFDLGSTLQTLQMEIVPPHKRGRFAAMTGWIGNIVQFSFAMAITARFDDLIRTGETRFTGETAIYFFAGLCMIAGVAYLLFFFREKRPEIVKAAEPLRGGLVFGMMRNIWNSVVADRLLWPVLLIAIAQVLCAPTMGALDQLLLTEQWGYSKQDLGTNQFVGGVLHLFAIPLAGIVADRFDRARIFGLAICALLVVQSAYYVYVQFILPDARPALHEIIFFGYSSSLCSMTAGIAATALMFDYAPRDKIGAAQAGLIAVRGLIRFVLFNAVGLWVSFYSQTFRPAGVIDYFAGVPMLIALNVLGIACFAVFVWQVKKGRFQPLGRQGYGNPA